MGLKYLDGRRWADVTRDERYFCMHLYNRIFDAGTSRFVRHLRDAYGCDLDTECEWELGFEVCFYRDLWHSRGKRGRLYSGKRTFDLALFSDQAIVVVEAKAQQAFDSKQLEEFGQDRAQITKETGVERVLMLGLCSSQHAPSPAAEQCFDGAIMKWADLAKYFGEDPQLRRADDIFESSAFSSLGRNNEGGYMTGDELVAAYERGERFFVGSKGGLGATSFTDQVATGVWRSRKYETNQEATSAPNVNWFSLDEFVRRVGEAG